MQQEERYFSAEDVPGQGHMRACHCFLEPFWMMTWSQAFLLFDSFRLRQDLRATTLGRTPLSMGPAE